MNRTFFMCICVDALCLFFDGWWGKRPGVRNVVVPVLFRCDARTVAFRESAPPTAGVVRYVHDEILSSHCKITIFFLNTQRFLIVFAVYPSFLSYFCFTNMVILLSFMTVFPP